MRLYVAGVGLHGAGYPNAARTVALLQRQPDIEVVQCGRWLPEGLHLWKLARMPRLEALRWLLLLVLGNLASLIRVCMRSHRAPGPTYIPYPGLFFLYWASFLPRRWRPRCIVDGYISVWDSMFRDRAADATGTLVARGLKRIEGRALRAAALVLVDTEANRDLCIGEFDLEPTKVRSLPLAIDEGRFNGVLSSEAAASDTPIRVLFVGTLIPLHGIGVVLDAISLLLADPRFEFRLIGNGQQADQVSRFFERHPGTRVTWVREWCPLDRIAAEIASADICLGVFGGSGKAARVLPFKLYMYLACGRPVVSQAALATPLGVPSPPIEALERAGGPALADAIRRLADNPSLRQTMGRDSADYFRHWLSNACVVAAWRDILEKEAGASI